MKRWFAPAGALALALGWVCACSSFGEGAPDVDPQPEAAAPSDATPDGTTAVAPDGQPPTDAGADVDPGVIYQDNFDRDAACAQFVAVAAGGNVSIVSAIPGAGGAGAACRYCVGAGATEANAFITVPSRGAGTYTLDLNVRTDTNPSPLVQPWLYAGSDGGTGDFVRDTEGSVQFVLGAGFDPKTRHFVITDADTLEFHFYVYLSDPDGGAECFVFDDMKLTYAAP